MSMLLLFALFRRIAEPNPSPPQFTLPPKSLFWEDFNCYHPLRDSKVTFDPRGEKVFDYITASNLLSSMESNTPALLHCSSLYIVFTPFSIGLRRCLRTRALITSQFFQLFPVFPPKKWPSSFNFQKACQNDFAFYFGHHCPSAKKYSSLSLSSASALFTSLALNASKYFISFGCVKRQPQAWGFPEI